MSAGDQRGSSPSSLTELVGSVLGASATAQELLAGFVDLIVAHTPVALAWIGEVAGPDGRVRVVASAGSGWTYLDNIEVSNRNDAVGRGPVGTALRDGVPVVIGDIAEDPSMAPWRSAATTIGYRSCAALPLGAGRTIACYAVQPVFFDAPTMAGLAAATVAVSRRLAGLLES